MLRKALAAIAMILPSFVLRKASVSEGRRAMKAQGLAKLRALPTARSEPSASSRQVIRLPSSLSIPISTAVPILPATPEITAYGRRCATTALWQGTDVSKLGWLMTSARVGLTCPTKQAIPTVAPPLARSALRQDTAQTAGPETASTLILPTASGSPRPTRRRTRSGLAGVPR